MQFNCFLLAVDQNCIKSFPFKDNFVRKYLFFRMATRKRTRSENRETKSQESPKKYPPIVKVGFNEITLNPGGIVKIYFRIRMYQSLVQVWNEELWWAVYSQQHPSPTRIWPTRFECEKRLGFGLLETFCLLQCSMYQHVSLHFTRLYRPQILLLLGHFFIFIFFIFSPQNSI